MNVQIEALKPGEIIPSHQLVDTTMRDLGAGLPCGCPAHGERVAFQFRPPTMGVLKRIGELRGDKKINTPGKNAVYALARALDRLGARKMDEGAEGTHVAELAKLPVGDVLYLCFAWQAEREPEGIELTDQVCGRCGEEFAAVRVDVRTLKVRARPDAVTESDPLSARVGLRRGFTMPNGEKVTTVIVQPPSWQDVFWNLDEKGWANPSLLEAWTIKGAIWGTDAAHEGIRPSIGMREIDQLWPEDVRLISEAIGRITPSPDLRVEVCCPSCGSDNLIAMSWASPDFFAG